MGLRPTQGGPQATMAYGLWWSLRIIKDKEREGTRMVRPERFELPT
jgi:hypothetical protein